MKQCLIGLKTALLFLAWVAAAPADEPATWKEMGKFKLPGVPSSVFVSDDRRLVYLITQKKITAPGPYKGSDYNIIHCLDLETGKERFTKDLDMMGGQFAASNDHFAFKEPVRDVLRLHEARAFRQVAVLDTRSPNDSPPDGNKGVPKGFEGVAGLLTDLEFSADGKTLVTMRMGHKEWKRMVRNGVQGGWIGTTVQQATFWDVEKGKPIATLDCEDEQASDGFLTLLPGRKQMLVKFSNGVRMLDPEARKWGTVFPIKNPIKGHSAKVRAVAFSPDEKKVVVSDYAQTIRVFDIETGKLDTSFKVRAVNRQADDNPPGNGLYAFGPDVGFADDGKVVRVTLNDRRTVQYHDAADGALAKAPPAMKLPAGVVLAMSRDRRCVLVSPARNNTNCTVWVRAVAEKE